MSAELPYTLTTISGNKDISQLVISIDKFTDVGTGEIPSAQIMLNTADGQFITRDNLLGGTPIIDQFMELKLAVHNLTQSGLIEYSRIMIVHDIMPQQTQDGQEVQLELYGREMWLKTMKITGHFYFIRMKDMLTQIISFYNTHKQSGQPDITLVADRVPDHPVGTFDFGSGTNCYDAMMQVINRLSLPPSAGGAGDFFEMRFYDASNTAMTCEIYPLGTGPSGSSDKTLTIKDIDTQSFTETREPIRGNIVVVEGQRDTGRFPREVARWTSLIEEYNNFPEWRANTSYPANTFVRWRNTVYEARIAIPARTSFNITGWTAMTTQEYIRRRMGNTTYSPWTERQANAWRGWLSKTGPHNNQRAYPDSNLVVKDGRNYRNWVDYIATSTPNTPPPEDTRVLLTVDRWNGQARDPFNVPYKDALVQYRSGQWIVIHEPSADDEVAVLDSGDVYIYAKASESSNPATRKADRKNNHLDNTSRAWKSMAPDWLGTDCFHPPASITNVPGLVNFHGRTIDSAIQISYRFTLNAEQESWIDTLLGLLGPIGAYLAGAATAQLNFFATPAVYKFGWWATLFKAPFASLYQHPTIDLYNLNRTATSDIQPSYEDDKGNELGQITGIHFLLNFDVLVGGSPLFTLLNVGDQRVPFMGNLPFRVFMYDTEDNVWIADVTYRFLGDTQQYIIPFSSFRIYRARNPFAATFGDIVTNILTPELKVLEIFETRRVKLIGIQWQESYDEAGRYSPVNVNRALLNAGATLAGATIEFRGKIDGLSFVKAPIAIAKDSGFVNHVTRYHIMEDVKRYPNVSNVEQLEKIANAELQLSQFRRDNFTVRTTGRCDIKAGQGVFIDDEDLVGGDTGTPDTTLTKRKLSVKKINYTVNARDGPGGFIRYCTLLARINQP